MVVDDHPAVRLGIVQLLDAQPDFVLDAVAIDAEGALAEATARRPDVVVIDYQLPVRSGLWACRRLKRLPRAPGVVVFSAFADGHLAACSAIAGADAVLNKGVLGSYSAPSSAYSRAGSSERSTSRPISSRRACRSPSSPGMDQSPELRIPHVWRWAGPPALLHRSCAILALEMPLDKVDVARQMTDAYNRRDVDGAFAEFLTPDFEWYPAIVRALDGGGYRGREGVEKFAADTRENWEELQALPEEFRDLGDRVLVLGRMKGRGKGSGAPIDAPYAGIFDFRGDRIWRHRVYLDRAEALRAAGLPE